MYERDSFGAFGCRSDDISAAVEGGHVFQLCRVRTFQVACNARAKHFQIGLLHAPDTGEFPVGVPGDCDGGKLTFAADKAESLFLGVSDVLYIGPDFAFGDGADAASAAVAQVKMHLGMIGQKGLSSGCFCKFKAAYAPAAECVLQQQIGGLSPRKR